MKKTIRRGAALLAALLLALALRPGQAASESAGESVYFTVVNEKIMDLTEDTMPFWSRDTLYVSSRVFEYDEETNLGVVYAGTNSYGLTVLYSEDNDLRFDVANRLAMDKNGNFYSAVAIEKGGIHFFPLRFVCDFFGLSWTVHTTATAPMLRITSANAILSDFVVLDSAADMFASRYAAYQKLLTENEGTPPAPPATVTDPPVAAGQRVALVIRSTGREETLAVAETLAAHKAQATFLLPPALTEDGDLVRALVSGGYALALISDGKAETLTKAREALWREAFLWLDLAWAGKDAQPVLEEQGFLRLTVRLDRSDKPVSSKRQAAALLSAMARYQGDLPILLGEDGQLGGLDALLDGLEEAQCRLYLWR